MYRQRASSLGVPSFRTHTSVAFVLRFPHTRILFGLPFLPLRPLGSRVPRVFGLYPHRHDDPTTTLSFAVVFSLVSENLPSLHFLYFDAVRTRRGVGHRGGRKHPRGLDGARRGTKDHLHLRGGLGSVQNHCEGGKN